jgi:hypothetical protein
MKTYRRSSLKASGRGRRGQVVLEYILLLIISVTMAFIITRMMVGRDEGNSGFVIVTWQNLLTEIGQDRPDATRTDQP